jgi:hypothetical protein
MTIQTVRYACHTAYLEPFTGEGLLVLPLPADDMRVTGPPSLHASDWEAVIDDLTANGWQPSENEWGGWIFDGVTADEGRDVIGLFGLDPIISDPSLEEMGRASAELLALAGVVGYSGV